MNYKFSELSALTSEKGYWEDSTLKIDRILIENNKCPKCKEKLIYRGFANPAEYVAFGICEKCDYARRFWTEKAVLREIKNRLAKRINF